LAAAVKTADAETFRAFGQRVLGRERYAAFVRATGYSDYEDAAAAHTLYHYGFDDTIGGRDLFTVPWKALVDALAAASGADIRLGYKVTDVKKVGDGAYDVVANANRTIRAPQVVVAVTASSLHRIFRSSLDAVRAQPFIRTYARFEKGPALDALIAAVPRHMAVDAPLQKIIPMRDDVFMVAYADNASAVALRNAGARRLESLVEQATGVAGLRIIDVYSKFWKEGTHYFAPTSQVDSGVARPLGPNENVWVVGEAVSLKNQGWVEGALDSVPRALISSRGARGGPRSCRS
jgi:glycine/D-amino acid oxidase-like deaminating enzyme